MRVYTSRYQNKQLARESFLKVGISRYSPRWPLKYRPVYLRELAPTPQMLKMGKDEFEAQYMSRLEAIGAEAVWRKLRELSEANEGRDIVLLCFEDLSKQGASCHRRMLGEWLESRLGVEVPELTADLQLEML